MKHNGAIYEMLAVSILVAVCAAVSAGCLLKYRSEARDANALDIGMGYVQNIADSMPDGSLENTRLFFDDRMNALDGKTGAAYVITAGEMLFDGYLGTCDIELAKSNGTVLFHVTASWQESETS